MTIDIKEPPYAVPIACGATCEADFGCVCEGSCAVGSKYVTKGNAC